MNLFALHSYSYFYPETGYCNMVLNVVIVQLLLTLTMVLTYNIAGYLPIATRHIDFLDHYDLVNKATANNLT